MERWWQTVAALGPDALIWLLGLATHGGTDRNKPATIGSGRTSNVAHEVGKARRYAEKHDLLFDPKRGYHRLRRVTVQAKNGERDTVLTKAKGGGHMQLTPRVGVSIFHHICSDPDFRRFLHIELGIGPQGSPAQEEFPLDAPLQIKVTEEDGNQVTVTACFACRRCNETIDHSYRFDLLRSRYDMITAECTQCGLEHSHHKGHPWIPPHTGRLTQPGIFVPTHTSFHASPSGLSHRRPIRARLA